ncbi:MAG: outer membrane beta-barrel protein [Akkermansiaceae bacterium]
MKNKLSSGLFSLIIAGSASAQGLYYAGSETQESLPLKWVVGANLTYDDNVSPGFGPEEDSMAINPYVGLSFVSITPQTTWDVYARLGLIYYFDEPTAAGSDDTNSQSRAGVNFTHRFSERLRLSSRNFISYELEPDYSYGYASSRQLGEYFFWQTDNSVGYRWTDRFGTYTGLRLTGTQYADIDDNDRFTWELYNQIRYQLSPQTILTGDYRYAETSGDGNATDSNDHYILAGVEHRFSANTIGIARAGVQLHQVDAQGGDDTSSPYLELALNSQVNEQFRVRAFTRYGIETYDTVQNIFGTGLVEFDDRRTLRFGLSADYVIFPKLTAFGGIDYIPTAYQDGRAADPVNSPIVGTIADQDEDILNLYIGVSMKINDFLTGTASYNFTDSSSDLAGREYDRNRISVGVSAEF